MASETNQNCDCKSCEWKGFNRTPKFLWSWYTSDAVIPVDVCNTSVVAIETQLTRALVVMDDRWSAVSNPQQPQIQQCSDSTGSLDKSCYGIQPPSFEQSNALIADTLEVVPMPTKSDRNTQISATELVKAIELARTQLSGHVICTPTIRLPWLDTLAREVWAKLECQQHSGSFKYRGAFNALQNTPFRSIITASAGNHALGVGLAGKRLSKDISVIVPTTASELKVNHLRNDANVILLGRDLFEATTIAMQRADNSPEGPEHGLLYLSPYANVDVAAGAGSAFVEATEDAGPFDAVILPLGGGGLAAAVGSWCSLKSSSTRVICTHPEVFGRKFDSCSISDQLCLPTPVTHADGLAVQLVEHTCFADILDHTIHAVVQISESEIAASIGSVLCLQSLLVEGAAATTVGALMCEKNLPEPIKGRVLLLLTGRNVSSSTVAKALVSDVSDSESIHDLKRTFDRKDALGRHLNLKTDSWSTSIFLRLHQQLVDLYTELNAEFGRAGDVRVAYWVIEEHYRVLLQLQSAATSLLERASAASDQSERDWFFDTGAQGTAAVNYARYGSADLRHMELDLIETFGLGKQQIELLLTSSGMAAYQLIENYLIRHLAPNETIVLPPYIYFEALEQLQSLKHIPIQHSQTFSAQDIVATAERHNARAVFVDPIANIVGLPTTDKRLFAQLVCSRSQWADRIVIIDGTLASGALNIYD
ncbi:tryptophan synthase beta subunit-like PLP-dependent enzyme [Wilcoxina mikolae CBS 423.85]|nr:tryptophan synthase beta subunit-like PLP-dependent enzyme [Wilcoxina mikolae CBS 423.85]